MIRRRAMGSLESEILATLWAAGRPLTAGEVREQLAGPGTDASAGSTSDPSGGAVLAYNTVQTILTRLWQKGAVERGSSGRAHTYRPVLDDAGLAAHRMRAILDRGHDQHAVLMSFLGALSPEQEATLEALVRERHGDPPLAGP